MKPILSLFGLLVLAFSPVPLLARNSEPKTENVEMKTEKKVLVVFFSHTGENYAVGDITKGNTHIVAEMIAEATGGRLFEIVPEKAYPKTYQECVEVAKQEKERNARPAVKGDIAVEDYDVVFIGCPVWWHTAPMIISTFAESYDFTGKTVVPFCTYAATYRDETLQKIVDLTPAAEHLAGFGSTGSTSGVANWLRGIGMVE